MSYFKNNITNLKALYGDALYLNGLEITDATLSNNSNATYTTSNVAYTTSNTFNSYVKFNNSNMFTFSNICIGTSNALNALTVLGNISSRRLICNDGSDSGLNRGIAFYDSSTTSWGIYLATTNSNTNFAGGNSVSGINFTGQALRLRANSNSDRGFIFENHTDQCLLSIRSGDGMVYARGNLGLGTSNITQQLDLSTDNARKLTTTTWATGSDRRVKTDIEEANLEQCYDNVKALKLKRFAWNSNIYPEVNDTHMLGFIAQEVKEVLPKSVRLTNDYGFEDFHNLDTDQIVKCLYGAVQKLIQKVEQLESIQ